MPSGQPPSLAFYLASSSDDPINAQQLRSTNGSTASKGSKSSSTSWSRTTERNDMKKYLNGWDDHWKDASKKPKSNRK